MSNPKRIYLQPDEYPDMDEAVHEGRTWAETDISGYDTEYVRADIHAEVTAERDRLKKITSQMLHTADGVEITPGMKVYFNSFNPTSHTEGLTVDVIEWWAMTDDERNAEFPFPGNVICRTDDSETGELPLPDDFGLYSTPEACAKARKDGG